MKQPTELQILTANVKKAVAKVTGTDVEKLSPYNDKRKSFKRRYKFSGIKGLTAKQIQKIHKKISKKHPEHQFVVENAAEHDYNKPSYTQAYRGLTIKVF